MIPPNETPESPSQETSTGVTKKQLKAWLSPPDVKLPKLSKEVEFASLDTPLLARLAANKDSDSLEMYQLTLQSEQFRLESRLHRLLSAQSLPNPQGWAHLLDGVRKTLQTMHGRALLCHEPGLNSSLGVALTLAEYLLRGLVSRTLLLVPKPMLGFWHAQLQTLLPHTVTVAHSWPQENPPENLLLPFEALQEPLAPELVEGSPYPLIAVSMAGPLRKRRSAPWRNLLNLSPKYLLLQTGLPFLESAAEVHGFLALLGVPELPPAARLKRQTGGADTPISPAIRKELRPFLEPVVLRNSPTTTNLQWPELQWKPQEMEHSPHFVQCRQEIWDWLAQNTSSPANDSQEEANAEDVSQERQNALFPLLQASLCGPEATAFEATRLLKNAPEETTSAPLSSWVERLQKIAPKDPRIKILRTWLQENPRSTFLIFVHHRASKALLQEKLEDFLAAAPKRIWIASTQEVPVFHTAIDCVVHFDMPWQFALLDNRTHWMMQPHHGNRQVRFFQPKSCPSSQWWDTVKLRFKPQNALAGELEQCEVLLPPTWREDALLWRFLHATSQSEFFEELSHEYLNTRRKYRKIQDLNQRLFLDDYSL